jgi:hypothetical protein
LASQGRKFNGTSDYISLPPLPFASLTNVSVSAWINYTSKTTDSVFFAYEQDANNRFNLAVIDPSKTIATEVWVSSVSKSRVSINAITEKKWTFVVTTLGSGLQLFVNASSQSDAIATTNSFANIAAVETSIGRLGDLGVYWSGIVGEVGIYSRVLNTVEINNIYLATKFKYL